MKRLRRYRIPQIINGIPTPKPKAIAITIELFFADPATPFMLKVSLIFEPDVEFEALGFAPPF